MASVIKEGSDRTICNQDKQQGPLLYDSSGGVLRYAVCDSSGNVIVTPSGTVDVDVVGNTIGIATAAKQLPDDHNVAVSNRPAYWDDEIAIPCTVTEDIFHYAVHEKIAFETAHHADVTNGATISISFKTPAAGTHIHVLPSYWSELEAIFKIREAPTMATDGTLHKANSKNRLASIPVTAVEDNSTASWVAGNCTIDATVSSAGTVINGGGEGWQIGIGKKNGGAEDAVHEFVLAPATVYCFEFLNGTTSANEMSIELLWFEVPHL